MYVFMYVCMYVCISTCMCVCTHQYMYVYIYKRICMHLYVFIDMSLCMHTYMCTYMCVTYMHAYTHTYGTPPPHHHVPHLPSYLFAIRCCLFVFLSIPLLSGAVLLSSFLSLCCQVLFFGLPSYLFAVRCCSKKPTKTEKTMWGVTIYYSSTFFFLCVFVFFVFFLFSFLDFWFSGKVVAVRAFFGHFWKRSEAIGNCGNFRKQNLSEPSEFESTSWYGLHTNTFNKHLPGNRRFSMIFFSYCDRCFYSKKHNFARFLIMFL